MPETAPTRDGAAERLPRRRALKRIAGMAAAYASGGLAACGGGGASLTAPQSTVTPEGVTLPPLTGTPSWTADTHGKLKTAAIAANLGVIFDTRTLRRIDVVVDNANWRLMQSNLAVLKARRGSGSRFSSLEDPVTVPGQVLYEGREWYRVGVRYKGNSSLYSANSNKLPFKLKFNEFEAQYPAIDGQRFHGFKTLHLKNNFHDDGELHELVADELFRAAGLASPHAAWVRLYVDSGDGAGARYFGVYTMVEDVEDTVLKTQYGSDGGNLYKPEDDAARLVEGAFNAAEIGLKTNESGATYADIKALLAALNDADRFDADRAGWKAALEATLDVPRFLKWLAANTVMQNWDSYGSSPHNYYLYADAGSAGRLSWIPWDNNEALAAHPRALALSLAGVPSSWPLIFYAARDAGYLAQYKSAVRAFAGAQFDPAVLVPALQAHAELIAGAVAAELPGYTLTSSERFAAALAALKAHVTARYDAAMAYSA